MNVKPKINNNSTIETVEKDLSNARHNWGRWTDVRHAVYEMQQMQTIKIGPFESRKHATMCRTGILSAGATAKFCSEAHVRLVSVIDLIDEEYFVFIQKLPAKE
jgi:hypothetical protein